MASRNIQDTRKALASQLAQLQQLEQEIAFARRGVKASTKKAPAKFISSERDAVRELQNEQSLSAKNLARTFGNQDARSVLNDTLADLQAALGASGDLGKYADFAAKLGLHLLVGAASRMATSDPARNEVKAGFEAYVDSAKTGNLIGGLDAFQSALTDDAGPALSAAGSVKSRLVPPFNIAYIEWLDAQVDTKTTEAEAKRNFIGNEAAQRAAILYLPVKTPPANVLLPYTVSEATSVADAFNARRDADLSATYKYYKEAYDAYMTGRAQVESGDVKALVDSAKKAIARIPKLAREAGYSSSAVAPFDRAVNSILRTLSPKREDILLAGLDIASMIGAVESSKDTDGLPLPFSGDYTLESPFVRTGVKLDAQMATELGAGGGSVVSDVIGQLAVENPEIADLQAAMRPDNFDRLEITDPRNAELKNAVIRAFLDLRLAYAELSELGLIRITAGKPVGVQTTADAVTATFKTEAAKKIVELLKDVAEQLDDTNSPLNTAVLTALSELLGVGESALESTSASGVLGESKAELAAVKVADLETKLPNRFFLALGSGVQPRLSTIGPVVEMLNADLTDQKATPRQRRAAISKFDGIMKYADSYLAGIAMQASRSGIRIRENPANSTAAKIGAGAGALYGSHAAAALLERFVEPNSGVASFIVDAIPSVAGAAVGYNLKQKGDASLGDSIMYGAGAHLVVRQLAKVPAIRFGDNAAAKAIQYIANVPADLLGDLSMGPCAVRPLTLSAGANKEAAEKLNAVIKTNSGVSLAILMIQAAQAGANIVAGAALTLQVGAAPENAAIINAIAPGLIGVALAAKEKGAPAFEIAGETAVVNTDNTPTDTEAFNQRNMALYTEAREVMGLGPIASSGFILEPGYNADLYSAEDGYAPLLPPPAVSSQAGYEQLYNAMSRARRLTPEEITAEGYPDLIGEAIIRATPSAAARAEEMGMGVRLGASNLRENAELMVFEVQGSVGLEPIAPERQHSVPQGAIGYPKIQQANEMTVSPRGVFNRGAFDPVFG